MAFVCAAMLVAGVAGFMVGKSDDDTPAPVTNSVAVLNTITSNVTSNSLFLCESKGAMEQSITVVNQAKIDELYKAQLQICSKRTGPEYIACL